MDAQSTRLAPYRSINLPLNSTPRAMPMVSRVRARDTSPRLQPNSWVRGLINTPVPANRITPVLPIMPTKQARAMVEPKKNLNFF